MIKLYKCVNANLLGFNVCVCIYELFANAISKISCDAIVTRAVWSNNSVVGQVPF